MKKTFGFSVAAAATMVIGGAASAGVIIYDNPVGSGTGVNQEFGDFPQYSTYLVADMTIPDLGGGGVTLTSVSAFFTVSDPVGNWDGISFARLHIFAGAGGLPGGADDPTLSLLVAITYDVNTGLVTTVGLNVNVLAGDYWIGLTPAGDFGVFGQQFHIGGVNVNGNPDAYRNPGGAFDLPDGTDWGAIQSWAKMTDINLLVEGVAIPAPGALALLGLAGLVTRRRRRR